MRFGPQRRVQRSLIVVLVAALLMVDISPRYAASATDSTRLAQAEHPSDVPPLPDAARKTLDAKIAHKEKAKKIGANVFDQFPMPICGIAGKCGALNRDGSYAVLPAYNWVDDFYEGRAIVEMREGYGYRYGYVDETGRVIWIPQFTIAGRFIRGFAQVDFEGKSGLIDRDGKVALWPGFGFVVPFTADLFWATDERDEIKGNTGKVRFLFDSPHGTINGIGNTDIIPKGKWGLVDRRGAWVRRPEFLGIRFFDFANPDLMWAKTENGWGLLRSNLSWQTEPQFDQVGHMSNGRAVIAVQKKWGYVDVAGHVAIDPKFDYAFAYSGAYAPVKVGKLFGLIDRDGAWAIEPKYDHIYPGGIVIPVSWWLVRNGQKHGLLDSTLKTVMEPQFDQSPAVCTDGRILGYVDRTPLLYSRDGILEDYGNGCDSMISSRRK